MYRTRNTLGSNNFLWLPMTSYDFLGLPRTLLHASPQSSRCIGSTAHTLNPTLVPSEKFRGVLQAISQKALFYVYFSARGPLTGPLWGPHGPPTGRRSHLLSLGPRGDLERSPLNTPPMASPRKGGVLAFHRISKDFQGFHRMLGFPRISLWFWLGFWFDFDLIWFCFDFDFIWFRFWFDLAWFCFDFGWIWLDFDLIWLDFGWIRLDFGSIRALGAPRCFLGPPGCFLAEIKSNPTEIPPNQNQIESKSSQIESKSNQNRIEIQIKIKIEANPRKSW